MPRRNVGHCKSQRAQASRPRNLLPRAQVELWPDASHALNGEYPNEIADRAARFWDEVDAAGAGNA